MASKRVIAKYGVASLLTALYGGAVAHRIRHPEQVKVSTPKELCVSAGVITALTWVAVAL